MRNPRLPIRQLVTRPGDQPKKRQESMGHYVYGVPVLGFSEER